MRVLLDTHAMYWYVEGDATLSVPAQTLIQNLSNEILISQAIVEGISVVSADAKLDAYPVHRLWQSR